MAALINERDKSLQSAAYRTMDTSVTIASSAGALFKTPKNGAATTPASITLTATASVIFTAAAVYTWEYAISSAPTTWIALGTGNQQTITNLIFVTAVGNATAINYRCTVTENLLATAYGYYNIQYSVDASDPVITNLSRVVSTVGCNASGTPISFANTDTTITVTRGTSNLTYDPTGGTTGTANTFKVDVDISGTNGSNRTLGAITATTGGNTYTLAAITTLTADSAKAVFIITPYDASGKAMSTITREIVYTKVTSGVVGANAIFYYLDIPTPVISKSTSSPLIAGTHSGITVTGKQVNGGTTTNYGYVTITGNGNTEVGTATAGTSTFTPNNSDQKTSYTVKLYNAASDPSTATAPLDTQIIPVVFIGGSTITSTLTNANTVIPTDSSGNAGVYTNTTTDIYVYEGATALTYDAVGTTNGTWAVTTSATDITAGAVTDLGIFGRTAIASNMVANTAFINFNITGITLGGQAFTSITTQTFAKSKAGAAGATGTGTRVVIITAYAWSNTGSAPTYTGNTTYTWGTGVNSVIPANWSTTTGAAPGTGYVLYQLSLTITGLTTDASTTASWANAAVGTIGYRNDGTIGIQGNSSRTAYIVTTSAVAPISVIATIPGVGGVGGDAPPTSVVANSGGTTASSTTGTVGSITGTGPWTATITGMVSNAGFTVGNAITATNGTGKLYAGIPVSVLVTSKVGTTDITFKVTGGTTPVAGTVTNILESSVSSWSFQATSSLSAGYYMYQVDGILDTATNAIAWNVPYLSNLKVGSLSAISANLGAITAGALNINNKFIVDSTGATTIQSGSAGARMQITENFIKIYDGSILRVQLGNLSM